MCGRIAFLWIAVAWSADVAATLAIFTFSFAFGNSSFYDAYWSVAPVPERQLLVLAALLLWAARLTANWARGFVAAAVRVVAMLLPRPPRWA